MRTTIYSERRRKLQGFFKKIFKNSFMKQWLNNAQPIDTLKMDPLTGLYNQFAINTYLKELHPQLGMNYGIILLNFDNYKQIQTDYGIKSAQRALCNIATILSNNLRDTDLIGRYGEHEFILILNNVNIEQSHGVAKRLLNQINKNKLRAKSKWINLEASCGISISEKDLVSDMVLQQADKALFIAKSNGINQIHNFNTSTH